MTRSVRVLQRLRTIINSPIAQDFTEKHLTASRAVWRKPIHVITPPNRFRPAILPRCIPRYLSTTMSTTPPPPGFEIDTTSLPSHFQSKWTSNPDPTALPFPRDNPPFPLTSVDWHQLSITDAEFTPHTWENLTHLIRTNQLDELKRWPSFLKAYLAWTAHVKAKYGSIMEYLLSQRLFWMPLSGEGKLRFETKGNGPFEDERDYKILRNDWTYAVTEGISHIVVWSKFPLPVDEVGALTEKGKRVVEEFVGREFRNKVGEERAGEKVLWFRNPTNLQSVRSLEHVHVLVRGAGEEVLKVWMK